MTDAKDPVDSLDEDLELLERHISILRTVKDNQPVGLIRLSEMTGIPKHRVRYSLKILEQQGIIVATPEGATVSDGYGSFMDDMAASVEALADKVATLRDMLRDGPRPPPNVHIRRPKWFRTQTGCLIEMPGTVTVVIPTFNEERNIANIARAIREAYPDYRILFMDDNSTDRSREEVEALGDPLVTFYVRDPEGRGLAASVLQGFSMADTDYAMCMDCDFQHPISALGDLVARMDEGADICVGQRNSRMSMGLKRTLGSELMEAFCKLFFWAHRKQTTKDMMSGLFAIRCDVFRPIIVDNWDGFELEGWKVLMDLLKFADRRMAVSYVRYDFGTRAEGESHLNPKVPIMTLHQLWGTGKVCARIVARLYGVDYYGMYPAERKRRPAIADSVRASTSPDVCGDAIEIGCSCKPPSCLE